MEIELNSGTQNEAFFSEYTSDDAIMKYSRATAGLGISYLLENDYKDVYLQALRLLPRGMLEEGIRILEFGCGAGMNLVQLLSIFRREGVKVRAAVGTDFSPVLIEAARADAETYLKEKDFRKIEFEVAKNESLVADLSGAGMAEPNLKGSFHFILGVNTIRYCHAAKKQLDNARDIFDLLVPGGVCAVIDMNNRFPAFRSDLRNRFRWHKEEECYVPTLEEYAEPFIQTGFELIRQEHFCWIPHSAGKLRLPVMKALSRPLNVLARPRAMRSLVVVRKPQMGA